MFILLSKRTISDLIFKSLWEGTKYGVTYPGTIFFSIKGKAVKTFCQLSGRTPYEEFSLVRQGKKEDLKI